MSNYILGDLVSQLKVGMRGHFYYIKVFNSKLSRKILEIFYKEGLICGYHIDANDIKVYFKYYKNKPVFFDIVLISTPGKKVYWTLNKLSLKFNLNKFNGFYVISTSRGLRTSNECLLGKKISGKVLLKVYV